MNVFLLHTTDEKFLHDLATDDRLFMDENGNYWCALNHADEDEFEFMGRLLKKVSKDHVDMTYSLEGTRYIL